MCRSSSDPCGQRRCQETAEKRRARQRAYSAAQRPSPSWVPSAAMGTLTALTEDASPPHTQDDERARIMKHIAEAEEVMSESDLHPKFRRSTKSGHRPPQYRGDGKPPMAFDNEQGWEVPTEHGRRLDASIRRVGVGVETLALRRFRETSGLTMNQIAQTRTSEGESLGDSSYQALADALSLHPDGTPATFHSRETYEDHVTSTLSHVSEKLHLQSKLVPGDGEDDVLDFDEQDKYPKAQRALQAEQSRLIPGDGAQDAWTMREARLDSEARLKALSVIRRMGGKYDTNMFLAPPGKRSERRVALDNRAQESVATTADALPRDWVEEASQGKLMIQASGGSSWRSPLVLRKRLRAGMLPRDPELRLAEGRGVKFSQGPMTGRESDALHEVGHHMEHIYPEINQIARTHKALRTTGPDGRLHEVEAIFPHPNTPHGARPDCMDDWPQTERGGGSWGRPDSFATAYTGVETTPWGSEVFSTGLEAAIGGRYGSLRGHGGVKDDPEHLHLILGILATVGRR